MVCVPTIDMNSRRDVSQLPSQCFEDGLLGAALDKGIGVRDARID